MEFDVAIIGAGLAGATAAHALSKRGLDVVVVEKARGPGGRMSTRRIDDFSFDHGAQYFTARSSGFRRQVALWLRMGTVGRWRARIGVAEITGVSPTSTEVKRYIGLPGMNALCKQQLAGGPECRYEWTAQKVVRAAGEWRLTSSTGEALTSRWLICTAPPVQARAMLPHDGARQALAAVKLDPCWAVMARFDRPLLADWDAAFVNDGPLSWVAGQDSRAGRAAANCWLLHATPEWSLAHLESSRQQVSSALLQAAAALPGAQSASPLSVTSHRWRYSIAQESLDAGALAFPDDRLVLAGDWCAGSRVEGAWLSGSAASRYI